MAKYVFQTARELGCPILKPITYEQLFVHPNQAKKNDHYFDEYGVTLVDALRRQLGVLERHNAKSIIIDEGSIESLNDILVGLQISDMDGRELRFKIEVLGRNENIDYRNAWYPKNQVISEQMPQSERMELWGGLIDVVEDWLEEKGITVNDIPNEEREDTEDAAIIYGSDYDYLADRFATVVGISRDCPDVEGGGQ